MLLNSVSWQSSSVSSGQNSGKLNDSVSHDEKQSKLAHSDGISLSISQFVWHWNIFPGYKLIVCFLSKFVLSENIFPFYV